MADTLQGFDRVLAYTIFGSGVLSRTMNQEVNWIPHGYNGKTFQPRGRTGGRIGLGWKDTDFGIGCVMTNQSRKDWGLAFETVAILREKIPNLKFWAHVDVLMREWDLRALIYDFGVGDITQVTMTGSYSSEELSYFYSACDLTILPSLGEGFGYPIIESMACGVPVLHGRYGGGAELIPIGEWTIAPRGQRLSTGWNLYRPVYQPEDWAAGVERFRQESQYLDVKEISTQAVDHLKWSNLWPVWRRWFLEGINGQGD
jgi:glycosyltransferase involved in cell wall biosynthesis